MTSWLSVPTGIWRLGDGFVIVVEGATVRAVNERVTTGDSAPWLSTARTAKVCVPDDHTSCPTGANGPGGVSAGTVSVSWCSTVLDHSVSPWTGGSSA